MKRYMPRNCLIFCVGVKISIWELDRLENPIDNPASELQKVPPDKKTS